MKEKHQDLRPLLTNLKDPIMLRSVEKTLRGTNEIDISSVANDDDMNKEARNDRNPHLQEEAGTPAQQMWRRSRSKDETNTRGERSL